MSDESLGRAVLTLVTDNSQFNTGVGAAEKKIDGLKGTLDSAGKSLKQYGQEMTSVGKNMSIGLTVPIVAIGLAALKTGTEFNASMANVATLIPGNIARVTDLKKSVQDMAIATGKSTTDLAAGLYQVVSAFGDTSETAKILEITARAAAAGVATTTDAINLTSAVTKGYGDTSAVAVQKVADLAFQAVKLGQTTFPELSSAIGRVTPLTAELGVKQEELFGVMATFTGVTGGAAEVSTQLRGVLQSLLSPTEDMKLLFGQLGVESGKALIEQRGLQGAIDLIVTTVKEGGGDLKSYIGSIEGQTLALSASGAQSDTFTEKLALMGKAQGAADEAFREQTEGVNAAGFAWAQFQQEVIVASQQLGDVLIPIVMDAAHQMRPLFDVVKALVAGFTDLPSPIKTLVVAVVGVVAVLGPAVGGLGWVITSVTAAAPLMGAALALATGPIGLIALAVTGVVVAVALFNQRMKEASNQSTNRSTAITAEGKAMEKLAAEARALDAANKPLVAGTSVVIASFQQSAAAATKSKIALGFNAEATKAATAEAKKHADAVSKLVESMGGGEAIAAANLWLEALPKIGGLTKLTKDEKVKLNKVLGEAIEGYTRLGQVAPVALQNVWQATADLSVPIGTLNDLVKNLAPMVEPTVTQWSTNFQAIGQKFASLQQGMTLANLTGIQLRLAEIAIARQTELDSLGVLMATHKTEYEQLVVLVDAKYKQMVGVATGASLSIQKRAQELGYVSRAEMQETAEKADKAYKDMLASGLYTASELEKAHAAAEDAQRRAAGQTKEYKLTANQALLTGSLQVLGELGKKHKAAAIAGAIINTISAMVMSFKSAPWPASLALMAGAAATGYAQVNAIRNSEPGFKVGTPNLDFANFGASSMRTLHGQEAIIPRGGGHQLAGEVATALAPLLASQRRDGQRLATEIATALAPLLSGQQPAPTQIEITGDAADFVKVITRQLEEGRGLTGLRQALGVA